MQQVALSLGERRARVGDGGRGLFHLCGEAIRLLLEALLEAPDVRQCVPQRLKLAADLLKLALAGEDLSGVLAALDAAAHRSAPLDHLARESDGAELVARALEVPARGIEVLHDQAVAQQVVEDHP